MAKRAKHKHMVGGAFLIFSSFGSGTDTSHHTLQTQQQEHLMQR